MKKLIYLFISIVMILSTVETFSQTMTELVVPKYFGSKSAAATNNTRTPFAICLQFDSLAANQTYDVKFQIGILANAATSYGAGNIWNGTAFSGSNVDNAFTANSNGSSGPVWFYFQPTGNSSRFDAGMQHNIRIGIAFADSTMPSSPVFVGTKILTALDIPTTERTVATEDDGCFIHGTALDLTSGKFVLLFDNVDGTGDPLFSYQIRNASATNSNQSDLPSVINSVYLQDSLSVLGDYPAVIPIGANNPNGVRRIEARNADNTFFAASISETGIWGSTNTTTLTRREVGVIDANAAPVPVQLVSFEASANKGSVSLSWTTVTETNNNGFEVERNINNANWEKIGFVKGAGNSTSIMKYSFVDNKISGSGIVSYRLKQIDNNGTFEYSNLVNVNLNVPTEFVLEQNYPNPFNPSTTINFALPTSTNVKLTIYNAIGKEVVTLVNTNMEAGKHSAVWNAENSASGMYFFKLQAGNFTSTKKMMLIK